MGTKSNTTKAKSSTPRRASKPKAKKATPKKATKAKKATPKKATKAKKAAPKRAATKKPTSKKQMIATIMADAPKGQPIVVYSKDRKGEFRWTLYAKNRRTIIAASSEGFTRHASATRNFQTTLTNGLIAEKVDATRI